MIRLVISGHTFCLTNLVKRPILLKDSLIIKTNYRGLNMTTRIIGTGRALPEAIVTNDDLSKIMDTNDEWISSRTGIRERRLVKQGETTATLAIKAAEQALENAGVSVDEISLIVVATCSSEACFPSIGCQVQAGLGAKGAAAFDISAACSGFLFGLHTAHAYLQTGIYEKALVIGTETLSRVIDWEDRGTCVLFGDGAGACVVERSEKGIMKYVQGTDGSQGDVLTCYTGAMKTPQIPEETPMKPLYMDGQAVFRFAVKTVPTCISQVLEEAGKSTDEVKYFILHQANQRILQSVAKRLKVPEDKFPMNLNRCGNTSAASIPILLDEMNREGLLKRGDLLALSGFGAGLTWAATLLEW